MKIRLLNVAKNNAAMNMAIDEAILTARGLGLSPNTLRFFTWDPPAITIGYFQSMDKEVDIQQARKSGIDVVRRYTGGGAVFHENELTYSIVLSEDDAPKDILKSYEQICKGIVEGLSSLGVNAEFKPINDIISNGKKISGNAQTRKSGMILQHGTILLDVDIDKMFSLLKVPDEKIRDKLILTVKDRVTSLRNILGRPISAQECSFAIAAGFESTLHCELYEENLTEYELLMAQKLYETKYSQDSWNNWR